MLTAFGKELRKLRIERGERIFDMAQKLGLSPSYVSAIERGDRAIPEDMIECIAGIYGLDSTTQKVFTEAKDASVKEVRLDLSELNANQRDLAFVLARKLNSFEEDKINEIRRILEQSVR